MAWHLTTEVRHLVLHRQNDIMIIHVPLRGDVDDTVLLALGSEALHVCRFRVSTGDEEACGIVAVHGGELLFAVVEQSLALNPNRILRPPRAIHQRTVAQRQARVLSVAVVARVVLFLCRGTGMQHLRYLELTW